MEFDAFSAGVKPGGLISRSEIRILVCYILSRVDQPVPENRLQEVLHFEGIANYFEVGDAIAHLSEYGHIENVGDGNGGDAFTITDSGRDIANTLERSVPITVRDRAITAVNRLLTRIRIEKETKIEITPADPGYSISCAFLEGKTELMCIRLQLPDEDSALRVKEHFLENAMEIYLKVAGLMTGGEK